MDVGGYLDLVPVAGSGRRSAGTHGMPPKSDPLRIELGYRELTVTLFDLLCVRSVWIIYACGHQSRS